MRWLIATPFSNSRSDPWLGRYVRGSRHAFATVPGDYSHDRSRRKTSTHGWLDYLRHAHRALRSIPRADRSVGIISCFPQLPTMLGLLCRIGFRKLPIVAWSFNIGTLPSGLRQRFARFALRDVAVFVVHSRAEIDACSRWLGIDKDRFIFVPLQCPIREATSVENTATPYVLAMGTANRDYALLFDAVRELGIRTIVVAGAHAVKDLKRPPNVELMSDLSITQCYELLQGCRVSVIPVANARTASGQVTLLDSLVYGKATIITDCPGSSDYIVDGVTALTVQQGDRHQLQEAIVRLWNDSQLRSQLSIAARRDVLERFSDEAVGMALGAICDRLEHG